MVRRPDNGFNLKEYVRQWLGHSHPDAYYTAGTAPAATCDEHQNTGYLF